MKRFTVVVSTLALFACCGRQGAAPETAPAPVRQPTETVALEVPKTDSKVSQELLELLGRYRAHVEQGSAEEFEPGPSILRVKEGAVAVDCVAAGEAEALVADLESLGVTGIATYGRQVGGWLPIPAIAALEKLDSLRSARAAMAMTHD